MLHLNDSKAIKTVWKTRHGDKCNPFPGEAKEGEIYVFETSLNIQKTKAPKVFKENNFEPYISQKYLFVKEENV